MLNDLISQRVKLWFEQGECPIRQIVGHIEAVGFLRDAQVEAIKTYLFLKIEGGNRPLWQLLSDGFLGQSEDLSHLPLSEKARTHLQTDGAARALFEFSRLTTADGAKTLLPDLEKHLLASAADIDSDSVLRRIFYGVAYPDYLFSLPMGAGKTFLMAAFIYLDLYFAQNEPDNPVWAHNFVLLVPSSLKSSILPSLKTIADFDPACVLPEPAASQVRQRIKFEILDQPKSASKSNRARNPNVQKISQHQPFEDLMGLVLVTNAEKVILNKATFDASGLLWEASEDEKAKADNELRHLIGRIPNLQILIDEVHHATEDVKLRQVVNGWHAGNQGSGQEGGNINGVLGFSGTPYLSSPEALRVADGLSIKFGQITNTVFYYPLTRAIQGFLKKPTVHILTGLTSPAIVRRGVEEFLEQYGDKEYVHGQTAKLAIYCGTIERLEEEVYPLLLELGVPPDDILKYHGGNPVYKKPVGAEAEFKSLDTALSRKRIVLLVQIGKEGWDCRSLAGVILSQSKDCPTNMVLQTGCRCLRQMDGGRESAGIWLNAENAKLLNKQLAETQQTSISEINKLAKSEAAPTRPRFSRVDALKLPTMDFYQLRVHYKTAITEEATPEATLQALDAGRFRTNADMFSNELNGVGGGIRRLLEDEQGETADFDAWLLTLRKGSFGGLTLHDLRNVEGGLRRLFDALTYNDDGVRRFNALVDAEAVGAEIRLAFYARRTLFCSEEVIDTKAHLLIVEKLKEIVVTDRRHPYPSEVEVNDILKMDQSGQTTVQYRQNQQEQYEKARELLKAQGLEAMLPPASPVTLSAAVENKDRSLHYVPYHFDSRLERDFLTEALTLDSLRQPGLELYFNGEGEVTEFRIDCFARAPHGWNRVGIYTPDFLLVERQNGEIYRALIIETKGSGFANQPEFIARRKFVNTEFVPLNNEKFGYKRFDYLYLSDADEMSVNLRKLHDAAKALFTS